MMIPTPLEIYSNHFNSDPYAKTELYAKIHKNILKIEICNLHSRSFGQTGSPSTQKLSLNQMVYFKVDI